MKTLRDGLFNLFLVTLFFSLVVGSAYAQPLQRTYGTSAALEAAYTILKSKDGNYVLAGVTNENGNKDGALVKITPSGNIIWQFRYDLGGDEEIIAADTTDDDNYIVAGNKQTAGNNCDIFVMRIDAATGAPIWSRTFHNELIDRLHFPNCLKQFEDGSIWVVGSTATATALTARNVYILKLTGVGAVTWAREFNISVGEEDFASSLSSTPIFNGVNKAIVVGKRYNGPFLLSQGFFMRVLANGNIDLLKLNGFAAEPSYLTSIEYLPLPENNYLCSGIHGTTNNTLVMKVDVDFSPIPGFSPYVIDANGFEIGGRVIQTTDGGYLVPATTSDFNQKAILLHRISNLNVLDWSAAYGQATGGGAGFDSAFVALPDAGGGYVMGGYSKGFGEGNGDMYYIKLNSDATNSCQDSLLNLSIDTNFEYTGLLNVANPAALFDPPQADLTQANAVALNLVDNNPCCDKFKADFTATQFCTNKPTLFTPDTLLPNTKYYWDFDNNGIYDAINNGTNTQFQYLPGDYTIKLYIENIITGCKDSFNLAITINPIPPFINVSPETEICFKQTAPLTAESNTPGVTYQWTPSIGLSATNIANPEAKPPVGTFTYTIVITDPATGCKNDTTIKVIVHPLPIADAGQDTFFCVGGSIAMNPSGGVQYLWSPPDSVDNPNVQSPFTKIKTSQYLYVTVTDANGCQRTDSVYVALAQAYAGLDTSYCQGAVIGVDLSAKTPRVNGCTYSWEPGAFVGATYTVAPATNTCYVVTSSCNGCISTDTVCVNVRPPVSVDAGPDTTICKGKTATLAASGGVLYEWSPNVGLSATSGQSVLATPNQTTKYYCKITDLFGCFGTDSVTVNVVVLPPIQLGNDTTICVVDSVTLKAVYPLTTVKYKWIPPLGMAPGAESTSNPKVSPGVTTTYTVEITDTVSNCYVSDTIRLTVKGKPVLMDAGPNVRFCEYYTGDTLRGIIVPNGVPYLYSWTPTTGIVDNPTLLRPLARPAVTTTYTLKASFEGCVSAIDSVTFTVTPRPNLAIDTFQLKYCIGSGGVQIPGSVSDGTPPYSYQWTPNEALSDYNSPNPIANPATSTFYHLAVTDAEGCISDTVGINILAYPTPVADAGRDKTICLGTGGGVFLDGLIVGDTTGLGYYVRWRPATALSDTTVLSPFATPEETTIYTLIAFGDPSGCSGLGTTMDTLSTVTVNVVKTPIAEAGPDSVFICKGDVIQIGGTPYNAGPVYTYEWTPNIGLSDTTVQLPMCQPPHTTTYYLKVYSNGCISHADSIVVVVGARPTVSIEKVEEICPRDSVKFKVTVSGAPGPYTYQWAPIDGISAPTTAEPFAYPMETTVYTLNVFSDGCKAPTLDTVRVSVFPAPIIIANPNGELLTRCLASPDSLTLPTLVVNPENFSPYYLTWSPAQLVSNPTITNPKVAPTETTRFYVQINGGPCVNHDSLTVYVFPFVGAHIIGDKKEICLGDSVRLIRTGGSEASSWVWSWKDSLTGQSYSIKDVDTLWVKPDASTDFILTIGEGGCGAADTFHVKVRNTPRPDTYITFPNGCETLTVSFNDADTHGLFRYWDFGDGSPVVNDRAPVHTYQKPGVYTVTLTVQSDEFCQIKVSQEKIIRVGNESVVNFTSIPRFPAELILPFSEVQFVDSSQGAIAWHWQFGDEQSSSDQNPLHRYEKSGMFEVTLTIIDSLGCSYSVTRGVYHVMEPQLQIANVFTPNNDGVNDFWNPSYSGLEDFTVIVLDRWGTEMYSGRKNDVGWNGKMKNGENGPAGVYFYYLQLKDKKIDGYFTLMR